MPRGRKKKVENNPKSKTKIAEVVQHLFRKDRVADKERQGWVVVGKHSDKRQMEGSDLVLMQKEI